MYESAFELNNISKEQARENKTELCKLIASWVEKEIYRTADNSSLRITVMIKELSK